MGRKPKRFTEADGYCLRELLHFGFSHTEAAQSLSKSSAYFDSAGYLAHLGVEVILKAWHLFKHGYFPDEHRVAQLAREVLPEHTEKARFDFLRELDQFYLLRYPPKPRQGVEIGDEDFEALEEFLDWLWGAIPEELVQAYNEINPLRKGYRVLMEKRIERGNA